MDLSTNAITEGTTTVAEIRALLERDTYTTLLMVYEATMVPLSTIAEPYLGLNEERARYLAKRDMLPLPVFRLGGNRAPWMLHLADLSELIDAQRAAANEAMKARGPLEDHDEAAA